MIMRRTGFKDTELPLVVRLLLLEASENHHETILSLIAYADALRPRPTLYVAAPPSHVSLYQSLREVHVVLPLEGPHAAQAVENFVKAEAITHVLYNTAYGPLPLRLAWRLRDRHQSGIVHDTEKLHRLSAMGWGTVLPLHHFWVLRRRLWETLPFWWRRKSLPLRLAALPRSLTLPPIDKPSDQLWIAIPGRLERKRRAYDDLIELLHEHSPPPHWRFLLLGPAHAPYSDWPSLQARIQSYGLQAYFRVFPQGLDFPTYHSYLQRSDGILPLIHPSLPYWEKYRRYQITGAFSMAFTHRKPLLLHRAFLEEPEFQDTAWGYEKPTELFTYLEALPQLSQRPLYQLPLWEEGPEALRLGLLRSSRKSK